MSDAFAVSRRRLLHLAGGAVAVSLASACTPGAPAPTATRPAAGQTGTTSGANAIYPTFVPTASGPKPDVPSTGPGYDDGFNKFPTSPTKALPGDPPGTGSTVKVMSIALFPPPTPFAQNPAWQAVNKALNADMQFDVVSQADYPVKLGTVMASNDMPDVLYLYAPAGSSSTLAAANGLPQFLQSQAADLTPYLAGDAAKDYPNLAAIPTPAWKNAGCVYQNHLYLIPIHRYLPGQMFVKNADVWDSELGKDYAPKNADDFKRVLQALTKPQQGFYGIAAAQDSVMHLATFASIFGAPNGWRLDPGGKLIRDVETPEYRAATAYARDLFASGVFHPDSLSMASNVIARTQFYARKFAVHRDPINGWQDAWRHSLQVSPPFDVRPIPLFPAQDGGKTSHFVTGGHLWATALKKSTPERTKELLRIMNWLAAPFGSAEDQLLTFGLKDVDYTLDESGNPTLTDQGNGDANYVPWKYTTQHPFVFFSPDLPNYAQVMADTEKLMMPSAVSDPTFGQVSTTSFSKGFTLMKTLNDGLVDIVVGRRDMSDYDQLVKDFLDGGGEQIRKEYSASIAASAA
ncbi:MAG: extracellular solute-binding protein [Chloroflexi bacterium]|nr:extracellular solute-binding protein [Chloroflexota bacterium]MBV9897120.1 extracellular solute-binding protein [Chloroflexota bacterium]